MAKNLMGAAHTIISDIWQPYLKSLRSIRAPLLISPAIEKATLTIGGLAIRLVFHSQTLRTAILPAFAHLLSEDAPDLTLHLHDFDSAALGQKMVLLLDPPEDDDAFRLMDSPALTCFAQARGKILGLIDWDRDEAYWIVRSPADISYIERSSPLRPLLTHWLGRRGQYLVHAAAVGDSRGAVLILGHGGAGKSTTALDCLEAGLEYVSDDHCLVEVGLEPAVNSLFSTGKLAEQQLQHFPLIAATGETEGRPEDEKVVLYLSRLTSLSIKTRLPLRAILLAHITGRQETTLRQITPARAFRAIAPSCALHFPLARSDALSCFGRLVKVLPAYVLELGTARESTSTVIRALLASQSTEQ
jgi:hypothetical protein